MNETEMKPLNWQPAPDVGYSVVRRPDGGMHYTFTNATRATLEHWREFALEHLLSSDRLTRNLYDLRQVEDVPEEALNYALELSSDPATRNIRIAVVVANETVLNAVRKIAALTNPAGPEWGIFTSLEEAEDWLERPLTIL